MRFGFGPFDFLRKDRLFVPEPEPEEEVIDTKHSRRFFFGIMAGAAASAIVVPQLIETSVDIGIVFPDLVVAGNRLLTVQEITQETLKILQKNFTFTRAVGRNYQACFGMKIGDTLNIRRSAGIQHET